jgi:hypothetical protein
LAKPTIVISGSAQSAEPNAYWIKWWHEKGYRILDSPLPTRGPVLETYPVVYRSFYASILSADILFIVNSSQTPLPGTISAGSFAELSFAVAIRQITEAQLPRVILATNVPSAAHGAGEIQCWLQLGWIEVFTPDLD